MHPSALLACLTGLIFALPGRAVADLCLRRNLDRQESPSSAAIMASKEYGLLLGEIDRSGNLDPLAKSLFRAMAAETGSFHEVAELRSALGLLRENPAFSERLSSLLATYLGSTTPLSKARVIDASKNVRELQTKIRVKLAKEARRSYRAKYKPDVIADEPPTVDELKELREVHRLVALERPSQSDKLRQVQEIRERLRARKTPPLKRTEPSAEELELIAALELYQRFPDDWAYFNRRYVDPNPARFTTIDGKLARRRYESDIEMGCCIVEVSNIFDPAELRAKKLQQVERFVNRHPSREYDYINPDGKDVILYLPKFPGTPDWLPPGVRVARTLDELKALVEESIRARGSGDRGSRPPSTPPPASGIRRK